MKQSFIFRPRKAQDDLILLGSLCFVLFSLCLEKSPNSDSHKGKSLETATEKHTAVISLAKLYYSTEYSGIYKRIKACGESDKGSDYNIFKKNCPDQVIFLFQLFIPKTLKGLFHFPEILLS